MSLRLRGSAALAVLAVLCAVAACAADTSTEAPAPAPPPDASSESRTFCRSAVELGRIVADGPDVDVETATPDEVGTAFQEFGAMVEPLLATMEESAPDVVRGQISTIARSTRQAVAARDTTAIETEGFDVARATVDGYLLGECGYPTIHVTVHEHQFSGVPPTLAPGTVAFVLENVGIEPHELDIDKVEVADSGSAQPYRDILGLPEDVGDPLHSGVGNLGVDPGESRTVFLTLEPGRYGVACFETQGSTADLPGTGPPHFTLGEVAEFTVP